MKIAYAVLSLLLLSGCNALNRLVGDDPKKDPPAAEQGRVFGSFPGDPASRFLGLPSGVKTFELEQTGLAVTGDYFDGVNTYQLSGTVTGASASFTVTGPGCVSPTSLKIHYVPGIINYHFVVDEFSGCGAAKPTEDFCVENSTYCGSGL